MSTTIRLLPEARAIANQFPQKTLNSLLNSVLLCIGRQARMIEGVAPLDTEEFCKRLGVADITPQWQRLGYHDREAIRQAQRMTVGLNAPPTPESKAKEEAMHVEWCIKRSLTKCQRFKPEHKSGSFAQTGLHFFEGTYYGFEKILKAPPHPSNYIFREPTTPKDLAAKSEPLAQLVALATLYCRSSLERACKLATGNTLEALTREIAVLVDIYQPAPIQGGKRRLPGNSS